MRLRRRAVRSSGSGVDVAPEARKPDMLPGAPDTQRSYSFPPGPMSQRNIPRAHASFSVRRTIVGNERETPLAVRRSYCRRATALPFAEWRCQELCRRCEYRSGAGAGKRFPRSIEWIRQGRDVRPAHGVAPLDQIHDRIDGSTKAHAGHRSLAVQGGIERFEDEVLLERGLDEDLLDLMANRIKKFDAVAIRFSPGDAARTGQSTHADRKIEVCRDGSVLWRSNEASVRGNICDKARNRIAGERRKDPCFEIALLSRKAPPITHLICLLLH